MDFDTRVKTAIFRWVAETTRVPSAAELAEAIREKPDDIREAYRRLFGKRVLFLEPDGETIRMAPPFSGVETQHRVAIGDRSYFAKCSWDSLGIPAALHAEAEVFSRCEQTLEPIYLRSRPMVPTRSPSWLTLRSRRRSGGRTSSTPEARCSSSGRRSASMNGAGRTVFRGGR